jgi:outer membrane protein assembly factor BamB
VYSSLLVDGDYLYDVTEDGKACCRNRKGPKLLWQQRIGGNHRASPILVDGRIYFMSQEGETTIVAAGPRYQELGRCHIDDEVFASPAVADGKLYIRSHQYLWCIEGKPSASLAKGPRNDTADASASVGR